MTGDDYRIRISGHAQISDSQIASGQNVRQVRQSGQTPATSPVEQAIARVAALLDEHTDQLPDAHRARRDLDDIRTEIAEDDPDTDRLRHALQRLGTRVSGVTVLVQAVHDLAALVTGGN